MDTKRANSVEMVVTDLDNTLYNWVDFYVPSFLAMLHEIHLISGGIDENDLRTSFKRLHEKYGTSEYSFAIEELDVLRQCEQGKSSKQILEKYWPAVEAFRATRKDKLKLYPGVQETLQKLKSSGKLLVAQTDSIGFYSFRRLRSLGIEEFFDGICAPEDHGIPNHLTAQSTRSQDSREYLTSIPKQIMLPKGIRKPNPMILHSILTAFTVEPAQTIFVGDSLSRDIVMAQEAGVIDVYAEYGNQYDPANYEELKSITYWTKADVERENEVRPSMTQPPTFTIQKFSDLNGVIKLVEAGLQKSKA